MGHSYSFLMTIQLNLAKQLGKREGRMTQMRRKNGDLILIMNGEALEFPGQLSTVMKLLIDGKGRKQLLTRRALAQALWGVTTIPDDVLWNRQDVLFSKLREIIPGFVETKRNGGWRLSSKIRISSKGKVAIVADTPEPKEEKPPEYQIIVTIRGKVLTFQNDAARVLSVLLKNRLRPLNAADLARAIYGDASYQSPVYRALATLKKQLKPDDFYMCGRRGQRLASHLSIKINLETST